MSQIMEMKADAEEFIKNDLYYESMPRPTYDENRGLDLNLIERGQLEPIKVNREMVILDGYTRWMLLGDRGKKIWYEFRDFDTFEDELNYVVECNIMRRNINTYQRVESMLKLFGNQRYRKENSDTFKRSYLLILQAIKDGNINSRDIAECINQELTNTRSTLKKLTLQHYIRRNTVDLETGGNEFRYQILPKGEELLAKKPMIKTMKEIGKDIGVDRNTVGKAIFLIENADANIKTRLINNTITIGQAYELVRGRKTVNYKRVNPNTGLRCPSCNSVHKKKEYDIVEM